MKALKVRSHRLNSAALLGGAAFALASLSASALDINGFTTPGDANCWLNPNCSIPRGGNSDVMTVYAPDGSIYQQIFAFGNEEANNIYYFDPALVPIDPALIGHVTVLLEDSSGLFSDAFGIGQLPSATGASGGFALGFISDPSNLPPQNVVIDQYLIEQPDGPNPVPEPGSQDSAYLTIPYNATQYLSLGFRTAGYTAVFQSDVPEPATLALLGIGFAALGFHRRRKQASAV